MSWKQCYIGWIMILLDIGNCICSWARVEVSFCVFYPYNRYVSIYLKKSTMIWSPPRFIRPVTVYIGEHTLQSWNESRLCWLFQRNSQFLIVKLTVLTHRCFKHLLTVSVSPDCRKWMATFITHGWLVYISFLVAPISLKPLFCALHYHLSKKEEEE